MPQPHAQKMSLRPPIPREHGAWGILGGAFLSAVAYAGALTPGMLVFLLALVSFYFSRCALLLALGKRPYPHSRIWFAVFALIGLSALAGAAAIARFWPLMFWCMILVPFFAAELLLIRAHKQQSLLAQIVGTTGLTLAAPLAYAVYASGWVQDALILWLLNMAFFMGLILFVRFQIVRMSARAYQESGSRGHGKRARNPYVRALLLYNAALIAALSIAAIVSSGEYARIGIVFLPSILQAPAAAAGMLKIRTIRRLGWLQMAHTVVFVVLLGILK